MYPCHCSIKDSRRSNLCLADFLCRVSALCPHPTPGTSPGGRRQEQKRLLQDSLSQMTVPKPGESTIFLSSHDLVSPHSFALPQLPEFTALLPCFCKSCLVTLGSFFFWIIPWRERGRKRRRRRQRTRRRKRKRKEESAPDPRWLAARQGGRGFRVWKKTKV